MTAVMGVHTRDNVRAKDDASGAAWHTRAFTILKRSFQSFGSDKCATLSAAIAYYTVFALFPMALVGVSLLGFFIDDAAARQQVVQGFARVITLGEAGEQALAETLQGVTRARGFLGIVGILTAAWSASGLFGAMRSALNSVWDVDQTRPMLRAKAVDLLLFVGFGGLLAMSTMITGVLQALRDADAGAFTAIIDLAAPLFWLLTFAAPLTLTFAAFLFL
jgi:membrane protein